MTQPIGRSAPAVFATTRWSLVVACGRQETTGKTDALEQLCRSYWYPLYAYIRRRGYCPEDAQDLTQAFFEKLLRKNFFEQADPERGRFRTFLLTALNHFLADEWDRANRSERGGGLVAISLDGLAPEERYRLEPQDRMDAAKLFVRQWAITLLDRALQRLEAEFQQKRQTIPFAEFRPFLLGDQGEATYQSVAARLGTSAAALKMSASRMRARCRELIREEIRDTVASPEEVRAEYETLLSALG